MNIKDTIIFSLAVAMLIIGLHQAMTIGFEYSYWLFMLSIGLLLWYRMRKNNRREKDQKTNNSDSKNHSEQKLKKR